MRHLWRMVAGAAVLLAGGTSVASAQDGDNKHERKGFWLNVGLGTGSLGCDDCDGRESALSGGFGIGGTLSQKVTIGLMTNGWTKEEFGASLTVGTAVVGVRFYPSAAGGFFLQGGLGLGSLDLGLAGFGSASETGTGAMLGVGYDFRIGRNVSLTPFYNGFAVKTDNADANVGQLGLGITVH